MLKIVLIGAGNVGSHLGEILVKKNQEVVQVFSRKTQKAKRLAKKLNTTHTNKLDQINPYADLYILAVSDASIEFVASSLSKIPLSQKALVVHTSGATPSTVFKPYFKQYGICLLYTSPSPRDATLSRMPSSA